MPSVLITRVWNRLMVSFSTEMIRGCRELCFIRVFQVDNGLGEVNDLELFVEFRLILFLFREGLLIFRRLWLLESS